MTRFRHTYLYILILSVLSCATIPLQAVPRLTVLIAVDGMHQQDLSALNSFWPQGGLRTLSEEAFQTQVNFPCLIYGGEEALTTILAGTTPDEHGIAMDNYFSREDRKIHATLHDASVQGIGTQLHLSPTAIHAMLLADKFRLQFGDKAKIFACGLRPEATITMAGHAANACCWLDTESLHWVTTSFYDEGLPSAADKHNTNERLQELNQREWQPRIDIAQYLRPTDEEKKKSFHYIGFKKGHSPVANEAVTELALAIQKDQQMGSDLIPDLLLLQMTVLSPKAKADHILSAEQEDMYMSVNQHIGYIMEQLDKRIGKSNYQLMVVGLPRLGSSADELKRVGLPRQEFNLDRVVALLGTYLMAIYGHERWIDGGYGNAIFLNRNLIEQKKLSYEHICRQVSDFLLEFSGVQGACPASEMMYYPSHGEPGKLRYSLAKPQRGDVLFWLNENWVSMQREGMPTDLVPDRSPAIPVLHWSGAMRNYPDKQSVNILNLTNLIIE